MHPFEQPGITYLISWGAAARFHHICLFSSSNKSSFSTQGRCSSSGSCQPSSLHPILCWKSLASPHIFFHPVLPTPASRVRVLEVPSRLKALHMYLVNFRRLLLACSSSLCPFQILRDLRTGSEMLTLF